MIAIGLPQVAALPVKAESASEGKISDVSDLFADLLPQAEGGEGLAVTAAAEEALNAETVLPEALQSLEGAIEHEVDFDHLLGLPELPVRVENLESVTPAPSLLGLDGQMRLLPQAATPAEDAPMLDAAGEVLAPDLGDRAAVSPAMTREGEARPDARVAPALPPSALGSLVGQGAEGETASEAPVQIGKVEPTPRDTPSPILAAAQSAPDRMDAPFSENLPQMLQAAEEGARAPSASSRSETTVAGNEIRSPLTRNVLQHLDELEQSEGRTRVMLRPQGLGLLEIDVIRMADGRLHMSIRAENPLILQSLQQEASALSDFLGAKGFDLAGGGPDLGHFARSQDEGEWGDGAALGAEDEASVEPDPQTPTITANGQVDILT